MKNKTISSLLTIPKKELDDGIILGRTKTGYKVKIRNLEVNIKSATGEELPQGTKVVIGKVGEKQFILGKERLSTRTILEVHIDG